MKSRTLVNLALALSIVGSGSLPALADQVVVVNTQTSSRSTPMPQTVIPQTAGVVISLPMPITVDVGQHQDYPLTVPLSQPLMDSQGNTVIPANSPVTIKLKPENGGARIVAESIVVGGQIVSIQASSAVIPGNTITQQEGAETARQNSAVYGNLFGAAMGAIAPQARKADAFDQGGMIGGALGILTGMNSPKSLRVVQLPQGSVYVLSLQAPIALPANLAVQPASTPAPTQQASANQAQFDFKSVAEYSQGLERVLAAYQQGQVSKADARRAIVDADQYATTALSPKLYPPAGQRQRIAQLFEFTYGIDR
ncbi:hypothetical protein [Stenomitos frigidus]|uniref:hypothetical protein n=1 Tax=Stenomitos frigidus TaxID=1886765 RepID=UPI0015E74F06|nr:hypothetical protein [Stenomitos frigidus]